MKHSSIRWILGILGLLALVACNSTTLGPFSLTATPPTLAPSLTPVPAMPTTPALAHSVAPIPATSTSVTTATATATRSVPVNASGLPSFSHVYIIVMENKEYGSVIGSAEAPFINSLAAQYAVATNYTGVAHPSEPNYLALFSGSTQGVADDGVHNLDGQNIADQLEAKNKTWRVFAQNDPTNCFTGVVATDGVDGPGTYARKHNPAISFTDISRSPARCANITDLSHLDPAVADYEFIVPNLCNDMHDCSVAVGDNFLKGFVPQILNSSAWQNGGVLFITWDEGVTNVRGGGLVPLLVISRQVHPGFRSAVAHDHYSLIRTVEDAWGLGCLNLACPANNLSDFFR